MTAPPPAVEGIDRYFAAATIAHEYVADLDRELADLEQRNGQTIKLVRESADIATRQMPDVTQRLRDLARIWDDRQLLDPANAAAALADVDAEYASIEPVLAGLRARQDEIAAALQDRIESGRRN